MAVIIYRGHIHIQTHASQANKVKNLANLVITHCVTVLKYNFDGIHDLFLFSCRQSLCLIAIRHCSFGLSHKGFLPSFLQEPKQLRIRLLLSFNSFVPPLLALIDLVLDLLVVASLHGPPNGVDLLLDQYRLVKSHLLHYLHELIL